MSRYAEAAAAVHADPTPTAHGMCCAPGCNLPGAIADATNGASDWYCALHHGAAYRAQGGISARIGNRLRLFRLARRLINAETALLVPAKVADWLQAQGRGELLADDDRGPLTCRRLGARMLLVLQRECAEPQARIDKDEAHRVDRGAELLEGLA